MGQQALLRGPRGFVNENLRGLEIKRLPGEEGGSFRVAVGLENLGDAPLLSKSHSNRPRGWGWGGGGVGGR